MPTLSALEAIITTLSSIIVLLLGVQITQTMNLKRSLNNVKQGLSDHVLKMTELMTKKVDVDNCNVVRRECLALNKTIIQNPLQEQLETMKAKCREHRHQNEKENTLLWDAMRKHTHTKIESNENDKVIFNNGSRLS